jgi:hypothetical protein
MGDWETESQRVRMRGFFQMRWSNICGNASPHCDNLETPLRCIAEHRPPVGEIYPGCGLGCLLRDRRRFGAARVYVDVAALVFGTNDVEPVLGDGAWGGIV